MICISGEDSITKVYGDLCIQLREIQKRDAQGKSICRHCNKTKAGHLPDDRCTISATSRQFHSDETGDTTKVMRALELIEELLEI